MQQSTLALKEACSDELLKDLWEAGAYVRLDKEDSMTVVVDSAPALKRTKEIIDAHNGDAKPTREKTREELVAFIRENDLPIEVDDTDDAASLRVAIAQAQES